MFWKKSHFGGAIANRRSAQSIVRGALALYGADQKRQALELISLLRSTEVFDDALVSVVESHFKVSNWTLPD